MGLWGYFSLSLHCLLLYGALGFLRRYADNKQPVKFFQYSFLIFAIAWLVLSLSVQADSDVLRIITNLMSWLALGCLAIATWMRNDEEPPINNILLTALLSVGVTAWYILVDNQLVFKVLANAIYMVPLCLMIAIKAWHRVNVNIADKAYALFVFCFVIVFVAKSFWQAYYVERATSDAYIWAAVFPTLMTGIALSLVISYMLDTQKRLTELTIRDPLTGLLNRRGFEEATVATLALLKRSDKDVAVAILDIDHFKQVNDTYGHPAGDQALIDIAEILRQSTRGNDVVARNGGEEFIILLPEQSEESAMLVCERIRMAIEASITRYDKVKFQFTASMGVVSDTAGNLDIKQMVDLADRALYHAKEHGRNRVVSHSQFQGFMMEGLEKQGAATLESL